MYYVYDERMTQEPWETRALPSTPGLLQSQLSLTINQGPEPEHH